MAMRHFSVLHQARSIFFVLSLIGMPTATRALVPPTRELTREEESSTHNRRAPPETVDAHKQGEGHGQQLHLAERATSRLTESSEDVSQDEDAGEFRSVDTDCSEALPPGSPTRRTLAPTSSQSTKLTIEQAKTMSVRQLAAKILGDAGTIVRDIDRPRFNTLEPIRFYSRAIAWGSFYGLCASDLVTVAFDENGEVESLQSERHFGVEGDIYKKGWTYADFGRMCARAGSTKHYFPAQDHLSAWIVAKYVDAISGKGPFGHQEFDYTCTGSCTDRKTDLSALKLSDIESVNGIPCQTAELENPHCYRIAIRSEHFPKEFDVHGTTSENRIIIRRVSVHVGIVLY